MSLELKEYNGKMLTELEIQLLSYYEQREKEKKQNKEKQRLQHLQMSQNFNQINEKNDSYRIDPPKQKEKEKEKENIQVYETQRKLTQDIPPLKKLRPTETSESNEIKQIENDESIINKSNKTLISSSSSSSTTTATTSLSSINPTTPSTSTSTLSTTTNNLNSIVTTSYPLPPPPEISKVSRYRIPKKESLDLDIADSEFDPSIFPPIGIIHSDDWNPLTEHANLGKAKTFQLENFSFLKNQTLALKITVPSDSKRWSINIGPPEMLSQSNSWNNILFHFNPRYTAKRKELIQSDMKDGMWGVTDRRPFSAFHVLPTGNISLIIQIRSDGFYTSINEMFFSFFKHRKDITEYRELALQLPLTDDPGNPENAIFHKIWWGRRDPKTTNDFIGLTAAASEGIDQGNDLALSVFVGGLPKADTEEAVNEIKDLLWDIFAEYSPDDVNIIPGKGYGFIRMPSAQHALDAIRAINGYDVEDVDDPNNHYKLVVSHARSRGI